MIGERLIFPAHAAADAVTVVKTGLQGTMIPPGKLPLCLPTCTRVIEV